MRQTAPVPATTEPQADPATPKLEWHAPRLIELGNAAAAELLLDHGHDGQHSQGKLLGHS